MKNMKKLVALFAATTMAMSLSVSAFAASYADGTLTLEAADFLDTGAQKTMMAYVVDGTTDAEGNAFTASTIPAYNAENHAMIALDQDEHLEGAVTVDASKVAAGKTIVIKTSGSNGSLNTILLPQAAAVTTYNVTYVNADGTTNPATVDEGTTIKAFIESLTAPTKAADETNTYEFAGWYTDADLNVAVDVASEADVATLAVENTITLYAKYTATAITPPAQTISFTYGDVTGDNKVEKADYNAVKVYVTKKSHPKYTDINTAAAEGYVYGDVTGDGKVEKADYNAIKVYVTKKSHPKYTNINTTVQVQP